MKKNRFSKQQRIVVIAEEDLLKSLPKYPSGEKDSITNKLAAWSQVGTLSIVIFGYFYTVKPDFQFNLLQEKSAELELRNARVSRELDLHRAQKNSMELQLVDLGKELKRKTQESMSSRKKIEHLNDEYMASKDRADTKFNPE